MSLARLALLTAAGVVAGLTGTVAGLASIASYPALLAAGLPPLAANVTNTVALVFTGIGAAAGSRPELRGQGRRLLRWGATMVAGGACGALLLLTTPAGAFEAVVPWLVAGASLALLASGGLPWSPSRGSPARSASPAPSRGSPARSAAGTALRRLLARLGLGGEAGPGLLAALFAVGVYAGYFGAAAGVLVLALLSAAVADTLARLNAVKTMVTTMANLAAAAGFAAFGPVDWAAVAPLAAGLVAGGWLGPALVRRLPEGPLRAGIGLAGLALAVKLGLGARS